MILQFLSKSRGYVKYYDRADRYPLVKLFYETILSKTNNHTT